MSTHGYGNVWSAELGKHIGVHVAAYVLENGPVPEGWTVDHDCHNRDEGCVGGSACLHRRCCNPSHLRAATHRANIRAGRSVRNRRQVRDGRTECSHGHPLDEGNRIVDKNGNVQCRRCQREWARARYGHRPIGPLRAVVRRAGRIDHLVCGHSVRRLNGTAPARRMCPDCEDATQSVR